MLSHQIPTPVTSILSTSFMDMEKMDTLHYLKNKWVLWAHLPHNIDWSMSSYINIDVLFSVENAIAITETLPSTLIENCMLFLMKEGIKPMWEDPRNIKGGCFSYKVPNKNASKVWKELMYIVVGESISIDNNFINFINGITISPKKNFCIIKIWLANCNYQDPSIITQEISGLISQGCIFKKHKPDY